MRSILLTCTRFALPFSLIGCVPAPVPGPAPEAALVPRLAQVTKIELRVTRFPPGAVAKAPCTATVAKPGPLAELIGWLQEIDWSQEGIDLKVVKMPQPDGTMTVTTKDGSVQDFSFYWDGRVIRQRANRLMVGGDEAKLLRIVEGICP